MKRIVVKVGTNALRAQHGIDEEYIDNLCAQLAYVMQEKDLQIVLVSSGAIGLGKRLLGITDNLNAIPQRQAAAAIGQPLLMQEYRRALSPHGIQPAQILFSRRSFNHRKSFLSLRTSLETILSIRNVLPICNGNDSESTSEIDEGFGDNDILSALLASKIDADLLVLLSDIDGLYTDNPHVDATAKKIDRIESISDAHWDAAKKTHNKHAVGGMRSKLEAAIIARSAQCDTIIAYGREQDVLKSIADGRSIGTRIVSQEKLSSRRRWILQSIAQGYLQVDSGAMRAIKQKKSLLLSGLLHVEGEFDAGAVVSVNDHAKLVTVLSSSELRTMLGMHSKSIAEKFGNNKKLIARPNDIVFYE